MIRVFLNWSLRVKLLSAFFVMTLLAVLVGVVGLMNLQAMQTQSAKLYDVDLIGVKLAGDMVANLQQSMACVSEALLLKDASVTSSAADTYSELKSQREEYAKAYRDSTVAKEDAANFEIYEKAHSDCVVHLDQAMKYAESGRYDAAMASYRQVSDKIDAERDALSTLYKYNVEQAAKSDSYTHATAVKARSMALWVMALSILAAVLLGLSISKMITAPIAQLVDATGRVAAGDLTVEIPEHSRDEIGVLSESFGRMMKNLRDLVGNVTQTANHLASAAHAVSATTEQMSLGTQQVTQTISQVAMGAQDQARNAQSASDQMQELGQAIREVASGAQNQSKSIEEAVGLVQQISSVVDQVARFSQTAAEHGSQVSATATDGGKQVSEAIDSMHSIKESTDTVAGMIKRLGDSSQQIGVIIETIDDIAEQTNLLALNAAIEAARAGEHGRGFAVVADEVRKLAERSSRATGEIADLITGIQRMTEEAVTAMDNGSKRVSDGTEIANRAGTALQEIQQSVSDIVQQIGQVHGAATEMLRASSGVVRAMETVSAVTEETTAAAEEMAAGSTEVSSQAEQVAAISEESVASAEEVSAAMEQQSASAEELTASAQELAGMAQQLLGMVAQFRVGTTHQSVDSGIHTPISDADHYLRAA